MDLTGLSAFLSAAGGPGYQRGAMNAQDIEAARLRNREASAQLGMSIDPSVFDTSPIAVPPGVSSPPVAYPSYSAPTPAPSYSTTNVTGTPLAPSASSSPIGQPQTAPAAAPGGPAPPIGGSLSLGQIFARLKRDPRNAGIPDQVLFQTAAKAQQTMLGDDRLLLQYLMNNQRIEGRHQDVAAQQEGATGRTEKQQAGADARAAGAQAGADRRAQLRSQTQIQVADKRIDAAAAKARDQTQAKAVAAKYKELVTKRQQIMGQIEAAKNDPNAPSADIQKLFDQRKGIEDQMIALWQRQGQQLGMPSPSAVLAPEIGSGTGAPPAQPAAAAPATPAVPPPSPKLDSSSPPPTATDAKGNKVQWNRTTWVPVTAAPAAAQ